VTLEELIAQAAERSWVVLLVLLVPPLVTLASGLVHEKGAGGRAPWRYAYAVIIYAACIPGMFAAVLTAYAFLFRNADLLEVNVLLYFLPIVTMTVTLLLMNRNVSTFDDIPGFDRLSALMLLLGLSFGVAFVVHRMRIGIFFFGPLVQLVVIALAAFGFLRWATRRLAGS
jgi:hypothetical protein